MAVAKIVHGAVMLLHPSMLKTICTSASLVVLGVLGVHQLARTPPGGASCRGTRGTRGTTFSVQVSVIGVRGVDKRREALAVGNRRSTGCSSHVLVTLRGTFAVRVLCAHATPDGAEFTIGRWILALLGAKLGKF